MHFVNWVDWGRLVPVSLFGLVASAAWCLLDMLATRRPRAEERLDEFKNPTIRRRGTEEPGKGKRSAAVTKVLAKASPALSRPLLPKSEIEAGRIKTKLSQAGFRSEAASGAYLSLKFAGLIIGLFFGGGGLMLAQGINQQALVGTVLLGCSLFYLPDLVVKLMAKSRKNNIFLGLPDALDLMVVCVEAGLGLDQAMRKVSDEMKKSYAVIAEEFGLSNLQLQMGRAKAEVLHELGSRTGVDDLRSLSAILIQADKFGSSIAQALRVQSDSMRTRRRQLAEEKAAKTAVKLIFPLVIFIFPAIFVVLVGPAAITMINELFPKMAGH
jgi:tight adherence protein C